jgi:predicted transport protein
VAGRENNHYPSNWYCIEHFYCSSSLASERDVLNLPLFQRSNEKLTLIKPAKFTNEKELQNLIERNLDVIFNCRLVASEYSTGPVHGGRIDSLALSEENNPVIIEYKVIESSQLINQSLYYLSWINDHRGDFEIAVQKAFPKENIQVDWSSIRVICIAPEYKKYDLHAVKMMGSNIELWQYRYFSNGSLFFEEVFKKSVALSGTVNERSKDPLMVEAGKKAALTRATGVYFVAEHLDKIEPKKRPLAEALREFICGLDESVEEAPKKHYIAYKVSQNFVCMEIHRAKILLFMKVDPSSIHLADNHRDVRSIGHYGTGDLEILINAEEDVQNAKEFIQMAFNNIGGN